MNQNQTKHIAIFFSLAVLMAATRADHFGSVLHLPDASLAAFLLAGFYLPRWVFPMMLAEAGLVDYAALNYGGVDGWYFSPAYWFLIPTYFVLWFAGRFYATHYRFTLRSLSNLAAIAFMAICSAFLISNASFYLLSGDFDKMSAAQYGARTIQYFFPYLQSAFLYLMAAAMLHIVAVQVSHRAAQA